jgi:hypothetical protein
MLNNYFFKKNQMKIYFYHHVPPHIIQLVKDMLKLKVSLFQIKNIIKDKYNEDIFYQEHPNHGFQSINTEM